MELKLKKLICLLCFLTVFAGGFEGSFSAGRVSVLAAESDETVTEKEREFRAVWIAYYDFGVSHYSNAADFTTYVNEMFDNAVAMGMNAVVVHVRPFSDAMYKSKYYPWSVYASGKQGVDPGYDPLEIMVEEAHARDLEIHAWLNPYRITPKYTLTEEEKTATPLMQKTSLAKRLLSKKNPARKWLSNKTTKDDRRVIAYQAQLYYNPAIPEVQQLIINGVKEIVENYDVDGIHFDDYFYPAFTKETYQTIFDAPEYNAYVKERTAAGKTVVSIDRWRKDNVNTLVKKVYKAIKKIDPDCIFGISPGGFIDYYKNDYFRWYVDYETWMSKPGYIDYICPQLYWSFNTQNTCPYYETLLKWEEALKCDSVKLYVGLPAYKMNTRSTVSSSWGNDSEWYNQFTLANMITVARETGKTDGFIFFDYADIVAERNKKAMDYVIKLWDE